MPDTFDLISDAVHARKARRKVRRALRHLDSMWAASRCGSPAAMAICLADVARELDGAAEAADLLAEEVPDVRQAIVEIRAFLRLANPRGTS
jgi:phosphoketolase